MEGPYPLAVAPQGRRHRDAIPGQNLFADGASRVGTSTRTAMNAWRGNCVRSAVPASVHDRRDRRVHAYRNTVRPHLVGEHPRFPRGGSSSFLLARECRHLPRTHRCLHGLLRAKSLRLCHFAHGETRALCGGAPERFSGHFGSGDRVQMRSLGAHGQDSALRRHWNDAGCSSSCLLFPKRDQE